MDICGNFVWIQRINAMKWLKLIEQDTDYVDDFVKEYNVYLDQAKKEVEIGHHIIAEARRLPQVVDTYFSRLQEIEAVYEVLDITLKKTRSKFHRHYLTNYQQKLVSRDVERFVEGEPEYVDLMIKKNKVDMLRNKFASITKGLEYKHFQITNIVKLKAAGADDFI